jgi:hypothetical protein
VNTGNENQFSLIRVPSSTCGEAKNFLSVSVELPFFSQLLTVLCCGALLVSSANAQYPGAQPVPADLKSGFDAIKTGDAKRILTCLATKCEGRGTGQKGFERAAKFVAGEFKRIGLKPLGDQASYYQRAEVSAGRDIRINFRGPGGMIQLGSTNYQFLHNGNSRFEGPMTISGQSAFIEYAGKPAQLPQTTGLKQKVVFLHCWGDPFSDDSEGDNAEAFFEALAQAKPAATILIEEKFDEFQKRAITKGGFFRGPQWSLKGEPVRAAGSGYGGISIRELQVILKTAGVSNLTVPSPGSAAITFGSEPITFEITGHLDRVTTENVVGILEGSDPALKS